jgi:hypothetical protein
VTAPVTKADVDKARQALANNSNTEQLIIKAKACGLNCEAHDERCQALKTFLTRYLEVWGPEFPLRRS